MRIGVLHPGEMGISVAHALVESGHHVGWVSEGRSEQTAQRAIQLEKYSVLGAMLTEVDALISICPPDSAEQQAQEVADLKFDGVYVDANAVAPATALRISQVVGDNYVDGGIIGPPALKPGTTRLYLSGAKAAEVAGWFSQGAMQAIALDAEPSSASALKMAYAAYTKGSSALLLAVNALAAKTGVSEHLYREWEISQPGLMKRSEGAAQGTSAKAWRFVGEMQEIASTFAAQQLPGGFHRAAADIYERMNSLKGLPPADLELVIKTLTAKGDE